MDITNMTIAAIHARQVLTFQYDGSTRVVEPHILGYDVDDELSLSAWQTTGTGAGWRMFHLDKMEWLSATGQIFAGPRPGYNPGDAAFSRVLRQLPRER